ncbi:NUDIX hydrolase [Ruegeria pomeroyi]|uniref:NUDIX domain protein n=2 Tax=Ruegeria pomeroyi TaxID=89184 RepID=Q5LNZ9_RUEPO|nr:NUDIX hydrolase [Ruegeria pomeroyi]HCE70754.1 NUDIX domain-containing protein [Ruegeria sp.]AAV96289.1 NUDIX domain protein [Ruegeria pomeroyi DSS-3]NVK96640.1 NUDIX hydrolase [Ruegeria pomeroyi]NVL00431.1 NUDIX hydrolase [Ruegeria pomeroyi]QWV09836.1 NUDIX hydrolase [Ruegeria pomeroyi]
MNAKLDRKAILQTAEALPRLQYGALCCRFDGDLPQVLLITSRGTGRWILPKGWPIPALDGAATAAREAWEEAGATGQVAPDSLGTYCYVKLLDKRREVPCKVEVFALCVTALAEDYPEAGQRRRQWVTPAEAAALVDEPGLQQLLIGLDPVALRGMCEPPGMARST